MSSNRWFLALTAVAVLSTSVYAVQRRARPGVVAATCSLAIDADSGAKVEVTYKTLPFGPKTFENVKANPETAKQWEEMLPQMLGATFNAGTALKFGDKDVAAGEYAITFTLTGDAGIQMKLLPKEGEPIVLALRKNAGGVETKFLNLNLISTGAGAFALAIGYGTEQLAVEGAVVPKSGG